MAVLTALLVALVPTLMHPVYNPDLFWHLASSREAMDAGVWSLTSDVFSYTKQGQSWINIGWLSQHFFWFVYRLGEFEALALFRAVMIMAIVALTVCRAAQMVRRAGHVPPFALNLSVLFVAYGLCLPRAMVQAELWSLLFIPIFYSLRASIHKRFFLSPVLGGKGWGEGVRPLLFYVLLFLLWANLHGGFVWALGILGIGIVGTFLDEALQPSATGTIAARILSNRRLRVDMALLAVGVAATFANPHGWMIYRVVAGHVGQLADISGLILEWAPAGFTGMGMVMFWFVYLASIGLWIRRRFSNAPAGHELILTVLVFGWFAASHHRAIALFGVVCVPIFGYLAFDAVRDLREKSASASGRARWIALALVLALPAFHSAWLFVERLGSAPTFARLMADPTQPYLEPGRFPAGPASFIRRHPELHGKNIYVDWQIGGYAAFNLRDLGIRTFFDGRYLFHDLLARAEASKSDPAAWNAMLDEYGTDLAVIPVPRQFFYVKDESGGEPVLRTWHAFAYPQSNWRVHWWDANFVVLSRRRPNDPEWFNAHESPTRMILDPFYNRPSTN